MSRRLLRAELALLLAATFGAAAVRAALQLAGVLAGGDLGAQPVALNEALAEGPWLNLGLQLTRAAALAAWGGLAWLLLARDGVRGVPGRPRRGDAAAAAGLAALIGIPGLGLYLAGLALGLGRPVDPAAMGVGAATVAPLLALAAANAVAEELVVVGWLTTRLGQLGRSPAAALAASAALRGAYHLYQGPTAGLGNLVMGAVFAAWFLRTRRLWPLVGAHFLIDAVAFLGAGLLG